MDCIGCVGRGNRLCPLVRSDAAGHVRWRLEQAAASDGRGNGRTNRTIYSDRLHGLGILAEMSALPRLPTIREELDRKAFETIDWLITSYDKGKLTEPQFHSGLNALFMATSGLVDADVVDKNTTTTNKKPTKQTNNKHQNNKKNLIV